MEEFVNFITQYWKIIAFVVVVILEFVLLIFKGKTKTVYLDRVEELCLLILQAENQCSTPEDKMLYVLDNFDKLYPDSQYPYWKLVKDVENILSTPTKKGGSGREQDYKRPQSKKKI